MSYDANIVRADARDRWDFILQQLAPDIQNALSRPGRHIPCPVHGGTDGFRVFKDVHERGGAICNTCGPLKDGFALLMWLYHWDFPTALQAVGDLLGTGEIPTLETRPPIPKHPERSIESQKRLSKTWKETVAITDADAAPARAYFAGRGIPIEDWLHLVPNHEEVIRVHPSLAHFVEGELTDRFPAIICMVTQQDGKPVNLHRTYLAKDGSGKAPVDPPRKLMSAMPGQTTSGAAVRLGPIVQGVVQVAEGLETAVSVMIARQKPVWPVISDTLMGAFKPPEGVRSVVVWADRDRESLLYDKPIRPGEFYAQKLCQRLREQGYRTLFFVPNAPIREGAKSVDWNDILLDYGPEAIGPHPAVVPADGTGSPQKKAGGFLSGIIQAFREV